jgi:uncharacterized protein (DUF58 family)
MTVESESETRGGVSLRRAGAALGPLADTFHARAKTGWERDRPLANIVSPLGWTVGAAAIVLWILAAKLDWVELALMATFCMILLLLAAALTVGRTTLDVSVDVHPRRVVAGTPAAGRVTVRNASRARLLSLALELPIGATGATFLLPSLAPRAEHEELFVVPTERRGVVPIGPATTVRGDPFGLLRRAVPWTEEQDLFVHPVTVPVPSLGFGLLRDLEGQPTNDLSMSDLAFNALREFSPGDDRRFIHWKSSAKAHAADPSAPFLVRQFLDTRRSHVLILVDNAATAYLDAEEYEVALQMGASIAIRAVSDGMESSVFVGGQVSQSQPIHLTLDTFSRAQPQKHPFLEQVAQAVRMVTDSSLAVLITGNQTSFQDLRRAASRLEPETRKVVIRLDPASQVNVAAAGGMTVLTVPGLSDLPRAMRGAAL